VVFLYSFPFLAAEELTSSSTFIPHPLFVVGRYLPLYYLEHLRGYKFFFKK
jgi:hypothetical protein